jgi:hypothetical protein
MDSAVVASRLDELDVRTRRIESLLLQLVATAGGTSPGMSQSSSFRKLRRTSSIEIPAAAARVDTAPAEVATQQDHHDQDHDRPHQLLPTPSASLRPRRVRTKIAPVAPLVQTPSLTQGFSSTMTAAPTPRVRAHPTGSSPTPRHTPHGQAFHEPSMSSTSCHGSAGGADLLAPTSGFHEQLTLPYVPSMVTATRASESEAPALRADAMRTTTESGTAEDNETVTSVNPLKPLSTVSPRTKRVNIVTDPSPIQLSTSLVASHDNAESGLVAIDVDRVHLAHHSAEASSPMRRRRVSIFPPMKMSTPRSSIDSTAQETSTDQSPMKASMSVNDRAVRKRRTQAIFSDNGFGTGPIARLLAALPPVDSDHMSVYLGDSGYVAVSMLLCCAAVPGVAPGVGFNFEEDPPAWLLVLLAVGLVYTLGWMILRGAFVRKMMTEHDIADTHSAIVGLYLSSWFWLDLLTVIPIEFIFIGWLNPAFYFSLARHFLRMIRLPVLVRSSNPLLPARPAIAFVGLVGTWLFFMVAIAVVYSAVEGHASHISVYFGDAMYWAAATFTSVGYGDVAAVSREGRIFSIFAPILGITMISIIQAYSTSLLTSRDVVAEETARKKHTMHSMLQYYDIPWDVQKDVVYTFPAVLDSQREHLFKEMIQDLPPQVTEKLEYHVKVRVMQSSGVFESLLSSMPRSAADAVAGQLANIISVRMPQASEYLIQPGAPAVECFVIQSGVVEILRVIDDEEEVLATLRRGMAFGVVCIQEDRSNRNLRWAVGVQATQRCEVYCFHKADFEGVAARHPDLKRLRGGDEEQHWVMDVDDEGQSNHANDGLRHLGGNADRFGSFHLLPQLSTSFSTQRGRRKSLGGASLRSVRSQSMQDDEVNVPAVHESAEHAGAGDTESVVLPIVAGPELHDSEDSSTTDDGPHVNDTTDTAGHVE